MLFQSNFITSVLLGAPTWSKCTERPRARAPKGRRVEVRQAEANVVSVPQTFIGRVFERVRVGTSARFVEARQSAGFNKRIASSILLLMFGTRKIKPLV